MQYWWQNTVIYQIYLRSFYDSNNDGIGDIIGVIKKLDYLQDLGVETLWISPHYDSPMDDNGYDVRDFYKVSEDYGSLEDFKRLLTEAHKRNMKVITDLVLNHTSDEHPWFLAAKDPSHKDHEKYKDYYIWHEGRKDGNGNICKPTDWVSWFGGPVWEHVEAMNAYYLHIFSKKMPDLNWRNPHLRRDVKLMIKWWLDLGVDGFRVDASNHIEKNWDFPNAKPGYEHFSSLPKHHEYLAELGRELFIPYNALTIGEAGGASREEALRYAGFDSPEFNMLIQFEHCWVDTDDTNTLTPGKWAKGTLDLPKIKHSFNHWYDVFKDKGWQVIYWHNHDQPRILSHYGCDSVEYREVSAKMLAYALYLLPGTPIVYQGEEIGMSNVDYKELSNFRDVEVFTEYENFMTHGAPHDVAMQALRDRARDNARSPMQWDTMLHAGFSEYEPWIPVNNNFPVVNVKLQEKDSNSILNTYKALLKLRKEENLAFGSLEFYDLEDKENYIVKVEGAHHIFVVMLNFSDKDITINPEVDLTHYTLHMANYSDINTDDYKFKPYEGRIYKKEK